MRTLGEIIDAIKSMKGVSTDAEVASILGMKPQTLATAKMRGSIPYDLLISFCESEGCSLDYLLMGIEWEDTRGVHAVMEPHAALDSQFVLVPLVESEVAAGIVGTVPDDAVKDRYPFMRKWVRSIAGGLDAEHVSRLVLIRARGQSMQPTINDGELMLVNLADRHEIQDDRIYIVRTQDGGITVKRLVSVSDGLLCLSDNKAFGAFTIKPRRGESIADHVLGRVVWVGRELV